MLEWGEKKYPYKKCHWTQNLIIVKGLFISLLQLQHSWDLTVQLLCGKHTYLAVWFLFFLRRKELVDIYEVKSWYWLFRALGEERRQLSVILFIWNCKFYLFNYWNCILIFCKSFTGRYEICLVVYGCVYLWRTCRYSLYFRRNSVSR